MTTGRINQVTISERTSDPKIKKSHKAAKSVSSSLTFKFVTFLMNHDLMFVKRITVILWEFEIAQIWWSKVISNRISVNGNTLSTIPVLLTLHNFSAALKSSRSLNSLKIMISTAYS